MSVITYQAEEWQTLFSTLVTRSNYTIGNALRCIDKGTINMRAQQYFNGDEKKAEAMELARFVKCLYYANELCSAYNYNLDRGNPATIIPLQLDEPLAFDSEILELHKLCSFLRSIEYNCCSNGGTEFIPKAAHDTLMIILANIARLLSDQEEERESL